MAYQPNVIFIGLPHSGSTFLRSYFEHHPEIAWARTAEHFMRSNFDASAYKSQAAPAKSKVFIDVYELLAINFLFPENRLDLEKPRFSLQMDLSSQELPPVELIPSRIKTTLPSARIVFVLRNQITWLRSHYMYHIQSLPVNARKFRDYLNCLDGKRIAAAGHYHLTIQAYQEIFGKDNVHVLLLEQIRTQLDPTLQALCGFLGVNYVDFPRESQERHTGKSLLSGHAIRTLSRLGISERGIRRFAPLYSPILGSLSARYKPEVLSTNEISLLQAVYSRSNYHSSKLTEIDLAHFGYPV